MTDEVRLVTLESENAELRNKIDELKSQIDRATGLPGGHTLVRALIGEKDALIERCRFYESVMRHQAPHGDKCKIAAAAGLACCNPQCRGDWGTGCWCCHALSFASNANHALMESHLALKGSK